MLWNKMEDKTILTLTNYISVWGWQILSLMFLAFSFLFLAIPRNNKSVIFCVVFFLLFGICEYVSIKRKREFENEYNWLFFIFTSCNTNFFLALAFCYVYANNSCIIFSCWFHNCNSCFFWIKEGVMEIVDSIGICKKCGRKKTYSSFYKEWICEYCNEPYLEVRRTIWTNKVKVYGHIFSGYLLES